MFKTSWGEKKHVRHYCEREKDWKCMKDEGISDVALIMLCYIILKVLLLYFIFFFYSLMIRFVFIYIYMITYWILEYKGVKFLWNFCSTRLLYMLIICKNKYAYNYYFCNFYIAKKALWLWQLYIYLYVYIYIYRCA